MSSSPAHDPLVALWQTAPTSDAHRLFQDLQRLTRLHQRLTQSVWAILWGIALLLIFEEATGRIASHGVLSVIWILGLLIGIAWHRRTRFDRFDTLTLNTVSLLKLMIARAKSDLFVARCLYAGVPVGAAAGYVVADLAGLGASPSGATAHPRLDLLQMGAGIAALLIMVAVGFILAGSRRAQVQSLTDKLRSIQADL